MVVAGTADVGMVERQFWRLRWAHRGLPIEAGLKDGVDPAVRSGADPEAAAAPRLDLLAQQAVRHRVVMAVDVDMIVERDAALAPLGIDVGLDRQGRQSGPVEFVEQLAPADAEAAHRPAVELAEQRGDRAVQLGQGEEALVAQAGPEPAPRHPDPDPRPCPVAPGAPPG